MRIFESQAVSQSDDTGKTEFLVDNKSLNRETGTETETDRDAQDGETPITYHYLTFDTFLPQPTQTFFPTSEDKSTVPAPPDLTRYGSPFEWPESRKRTIIILSCICSTVVCYAAGSYDATLAPIMSQWNVSHTVANLGVTTFTIGFGIAPMILAPFSEINGRKPVFVVTGVIFCASQLACALTDSFPGMLVARLFVGIGGSTFSSTIGGVISDIYRKEGRNTPMALFSGSALFGTGLGPLISGFVAQRIEWRWVFWIQVITCVLSILAVITFFSETRGSVILSRKAALLNKWYEEREQVGLVGFQMPVNEKHSEFQSQRIRWKVKTDEDRETLAKMLGISVYRPFRESSPFHPSTELQHANAYLYRSLVHGAGGVFLFALGRIRLGGSLSHVCHCATRLHQESSLQP